MSNSYQPFDIGLVNFFTNSPYGSIHRFCPSKECLNMVRNEPPLTSKSYEYNKDQFEIKYFKHYFSENKGIHIIGYINQTQNFYFISKLLNYGLTFLVLNLNFSMEEVLYELQQYMRILKKNAPNANVVVLIRCCSSKSRLWI